MKIKVMEMASRVVDPVLLDTLIMKVVVNDNEKDEEPHCHVQYVYKDDPRKVYGSFRVSLIRSDILPSTRDSKLHGFISDKDRDEFARLMKSRELSTDFADFYKGTCWDLACNLWNNGDSYMKPRIPKDTVMPDYSNLPVEGGE